MEMAKVASKKSKEQIVFSDKTGMYSLTFEEKGEVEILFSGLEYKFITASNDLINVFNEIRHGKSLWKIFLIFAESKLFLG